MKQDVSLAILVDCQAKNPVSHRWRQGTLTAAGLLGNLFFIPCDNISNHTISKKLVLMLKYLVGWFSRESEPHVHTCCTKPCAVFVFDRLQSANCHFSCTKFGIDISHTKRGLTRQAVLSRQCSVSNKERARVCLLSPVTSESPLISLSLSISVYSSFCSLQPYIPRFISAGKCCCWCFEQTCAHLLYPCVRWDLQLFYSLYAVVLLSYKDICVENVCISYSVLLELLTPRLTATHRGLINIPE